MPGGERIIACLVLKKRWHGVHHRRGPPALLQQPQQLVKRPGLIVRRAQRRAHGSETVAVLGENGVHFVQLQGVHKPLPQTQEEVERSAQKYQLALQFPALSEPGHSLVHHGLENGRRHVLLPPALVQDGLDVALGEHAASGGDGVNLFMLQGQFVQLADSDIHQGGHLVNECPGAPGAGAVHALLQSAAEENDFGVLAAQLDDGVGVRNVRVYGCGGGVYLLDKVQPRSFCHAQSGGAGDHQAHVLSLQHVLNGSQGLTGPFPGLGIVPLVGAEQKLIILVQHHDLDGGGADVDANTQNHRCPPGIASGLFAMARALGIEVQQILYRSDRLFSIVHLDGNSAFRQKLSAAKLTADNFAICRDGRAPRRTARGSKPDTR